MPGLEEKVPRTPDEFEGVLKDSTVYQRMMSTMTDPDTLQHETEEVKEAVRLEQTRTAGQQSVYTVGLARQIHNCIIR